MDWDITLDRPRPARVVTGGALAALAIAGLAVLLYLPSVRNGYVLDDTAIVRDNPIVLEMRFGEALRAPYWPPAEGVVQGAANWRPLAMLSLVMERWLTGPGVAAAHHAVNAALHGLVVLALFPLARRLAGAWAPAACALFAAHPAHAEVVAPIVGRTDLIATLGALLALECFLRYRDTERARWLALGAAAYAMGLGGKESAAPVILLLPAADVLLLGRPWRALAGRTAAAYLPFAAVAGLYLAARLAVLGDSSFHHAGEVELSVLARLALAAHNAVVSAGLLLVPVRFHHLLTTLPAAPPFEHPDPAGAARFAYAAGGCVLGLGWLALVRRAPRAGFLWIAALLTWLPTSGLVPAAAGIAMRFLFLPTAFLACGLAAILSRAAAVRPALRPYLAAIPLIAAALGAAISLRREHAWHDAGSFFEAVIAERPDSYAANQNLAVWYATRRPPDLERARAHLREAIRAAGDTPWGFSAQLDLAMTCEIGTNGKLRGPGAALVEARGIYLRLIEEQPQRPEAHLALASLLEHEGREEEALKHCEQALALDPAGPGAADLTLRCARLAWAAQDRARAARHYRRFLELAPYDPRRDEAQRRLQEIGPSGSEE